MELTLTQTLFYEYHSIYYAVKGEKLVQIDIDHYLEFKPGNEVYYTIRKVLSGMKPIEESKAEIIRSQLIKRIKELI